MILPESKPLLKKEIHDLKYNNHEKQLNIYTTFHRFFHKSLSKNNITINNNNTRLIPILRNKIFSKKDNKFLDIQTNYNSFSPYVTRMISNAANLIKYNNTKYIPKDILSSQSIDESLSFSNRKIKIKNKNKKTFFGLDSKTPLFLDEKDSLTPKNNNTKYLSKSPTFIINNNKEENSKINKEEFYTIEDDILANKIFQKKYIDKEDNLDDNKEINSFFEKYSIKKNITNEEKLKIQKVINHSKYINKRNHIKYPLELNDYSNNKRITTTQTLIKNYKNPYHSLENLKINSQIQETVAKIRDNLQFQKYQKQFNSICNLKISKNRMPNVIVLNKQNLVEKMDLLNKKNVINYFKKHKNNILNKKKMKDINLVKNFKYIQNNIIEDEKDKSSYEERIKRVRLELWHLGFSYHPESRTMSSVCYDYEEKKLYNYGGLGGIIYGDMWECKFDENKITWKKIYSFKYGKNKEYNNNVPLPRYGHTSHFYNKKIFIIGGEYKDWKRDLPNEEIIWIYDIERKEWANLRKYEAKYKIIFDKRNSINLFKFKKNFSDITLKIPLVIRSNLEPSKLPKHKNNLNKPLFDNYKKEGKNINKKLFPCSRRNHVSLLIGSHIFIYGGLNKNKEVLNDCWIYDLKLFQWAMVQGKDMSPPFLAHHCGCLAIEKDNLINDTFNFYHKPKNINGNVDLLKIDGVFFFGGINNDKKPSNLLFHMSIGTKPVIFDIPNIDGKPPKARVNASMDYGQDIRMIIIYGGKNELEIPSYFGDITLLDLRTMNWIQPNFYKEKPIQRAQHISIVIGDDLIIFGGTTKNELLNYDFTVVDLNLFNK